MIAIYCESSTLTRLVPKLEPETESESDSESETDTSSDSGTETRSQEENDEPDMDSNRETEVDIDWKPEMDRDEEMTSSEMFVEEMKIMWADSSDFRLVCEKQQIPCHSTVLARKSGTHFYFSFAQWESEISNTSTAWNLN